MNIKNIVTGNYNTWFEELSALVLGSTAIGITVYYAASFLHSVIQ